LTGGYRLLDDSAAFDRFAQSRLTPIAHRGQRASDRLRVTLGIGDQLVRSLDGLACERRCFRLALEAFAVIRDAMRGKGMVALGRVVLAKRERVVMLQPRGKGLLGATLRYPYEVRDDGIYFGDIPDVHIPKDMLALAEHILESKAATFDPTLFHDRYEEAVVTMLNDKRAGMPVSTERPIPRLVAGTDLMAALRQSIDAAAKQTPAKPAAASKGKPASKGNPAQREILLPITGGAPAKEAPEKQAQKPGVRKKAG
jgi:DNA end-binding protein Ku